MSGIGDYRLFLSQLTTLDNSMNLFDNCTKTLVDSNILIVDNALDRYYMSDVNSGSCSVNGGQIRYVDLKNQVNSAISDLSGIISKMNPDITSIKNNEASAQVTNLKNKYDSMLKKRQKLDSKIQELYANERSGNDAQIQTDSAMYGALLWTVLATSLVYYVFVKL